MIRPHEAVRRYVALLRRALGCIADWHPEVEGVREPHLHVYLAARLGLPGLARAHLATPRVALEDVVGLLVEHLDVPPRRKDWRAVLHVTRTAFLVHRTWG